MTIEAAHRFNGDDAADAIVKRFGDDALPAHLHLAHESGWLPDRRGIAVAAFLHIDVEVGERLAAAFLHRNHADRAVFELYAIAIECVLTQAAEVGEAQVAALRLLVIRHQADLVHVRGDQHLRPAVADAADQIAQAVHPGFIG